MNCARAVSICACCRSTSRRSVVLKMALYFGVLYTRGREAQPQLRGLVLVDCTAAHGDATGLMS